MADNIINWDDLIKVLRDGGVTETPTDTVTVIADGASVDVEPPA